MWKETQIWPTDAHLDEMMEHSVCPAQVSFCTYQERETVCPLKPMQFEAV